MSETSRAGGSGNSGEQILGKDTETTGVLFDNMSASYKSIAIMDQLRSVSRDFRTTLDLHLLPVRADGTMHPRREDAGLPMLYTHTHMPLFLQDLHGMGPDGTRALFAPLLDAAHDFATSPQELEALAESDRTAYVRMTLLHTNEAAAVDIFNVLSALRENETRFANFVRAVGQVAPRGRIPFVSSLLQWMETHRRNESIQVKGMDVLGAVKKVAPELCENTAPFFWRRVADGMTLHFNSHVFRVGLFAMLFGPRDDYGFNEHASLDDFFETYCGDLAAAVAVTSVVCDIIERCLGDAGSVNIATRVVKLLTTVFEWNIDEYKTRPEYSRAARQIQRLFGHFKGNPYMQHLLIYIVGVMQTMDTVMVSQSKILHAAVESIEDLLQDPVNDDEDRDSLLVVVHAIAQWAADSTCHSDVGRDFLVQRAVSFIAYITPRWILRDDRYNPLHEIIPGDIVKLLSHPALPVKNELQNICKDNRILSIVMGEIYRKCLQKKQHPACIAWMHCLYALIEDSPASQQEVLQSSVMFVINDVFVGIFSRHKKLVPSAGALLVLLTSQSFDKLPDFIDKKAMVRGLTLAIGRCSNMPRPVVYRFVEFCDEMRKRGYLAFRCAHKVLKILRIVLEKYCLPSRHSPEPDYVLQEKVVGVLVRMAQDNPAYQDNAPKHLQTKPLKFLRKDASFQSAHHDDNMKIVRGYFVSSTQRSKP